MEFDFRNLRGRIIQDSGTIKKFCEKHKILPNGLSQKLNNKTKFSVDEIMKFCNYLNIDEAEIAIYFFCRHCS